MKRTDGSPWPSVYVHQGTAGNIPLAAASSVVPIVMMAVYLTIARHLGAFDALRGAAHGDANRRDVHPVAYRLRCCRGGMRAGRCCRKALPSFARPEMDDDWQWRLNSGPRQQSAGPFTEALRR